MVYKIMIMKIIKIVIRRIIYKIKSKIKKIKKLEVSKNLLNFKIKKMIKNDSKFFKNIFLNIIKNNLLIIYNFIISFRIYKSIIFINFSKIIYNFLVKIYFINLIIFIFY